MPLYAVKISVVALVLGETADDAIQAAREQENEIVTDASDMEYESLDQIRSAEHANGSYGWPGIAMPYGNPDEKTIDQLQSEGAL